MNNRKIIVMADDDMTNLTAVENALSGIYAIFTVPSGKKLFQLLKTVTPDLILLGAEMPEMDGYEVITKLKNIDQTSDIPVIFLMPSTDTASVAKGLALGAVDYVTKPVSPRLLFNRIEMYLLMDGVEKRLRPYSAASWKPLAVER